MLEMTPDYSLGNNIRCMTLTKNFFDLNKIDSTRDSFFSDFNSYKNLPIQYMDQVHGNRIQEITLASSPVKQTDAMISRSSDLILGVLTADCLPIAISNRNGSEFAIIHAGWRGLLSGIIEKCLSSFIIDSTNLFAWIGPSISSEHYEVGSDLYDAFLLSDENSESHFKKLKSGKWLFNIQGEAERILRKHKVKVQNSGECSYSNEDLFYSYRRNQTQNRLLTIIWRSK